MKPCREPPTTSPSSPAGSRRGGARSSVENHDLAQAVAGPQAVEGALDVAERKAAVDESLDREPAGEVERGVAREVDRRVGDGLRQVVVFD